MPDFATLSLPFAPHVVAPDGSDVRVLLGLSGGSLAQFELPPGRTSRAVVHRTVEEIWYVLDGRGEMWRQQGDRHETVRLEAGVCVTIPVGTRFQFRSAADAPLAAVAITMPRWRGEGEAVPVPGPWEAR